MNCFNHSDRAAVGICKSCGKALCRDCVTEVPHGLACKGVCEPRVQLMNRIIDNNARVLSAARAQTRQVSIFCLVLGGIFFCLAWWSNREYDSLMMTSMFAFPGVVFFVHGLMRMSRRSQYPSIEGTKSIDPGPAK